MSGRESRIKALNEEERKMVTKMKHEIEEIHIGKGDKSHEELEGLD